MRLKKIEMMRRGLRVVLEKVRRRKLYCLPSVSIVVLFFLSFSLIFFCNINR